MHKEKDEWEKKLEIKTKELKACQNSFGFKSCFFMCTCSDVLMV